MWRPIVRNLAGKYRPFMSYFARICSNFFDLVTDFVQNILAKSVDLYGFGFQKCWSPLERSCVRLQNK